MINRRDETLFHASIPRHRERAADVAGDDTRRTPQPAERPRDVIDSELPILPVCDGVTGLETIQINRDVDVLALQSADELLELLSPRGAEDDAAPAPIFAGPNISPRVHLQPPFPDGAAISENVPGPPALEIAATPHADSLDLRQLERPIHPAPATPSGRPDIPVGVVVERDNDHWLRHLSDPERGQM